MTNGKIIDPKADAAVQQAMASMQQQVQLAIMVVELRDRFALAILQANAVAAGREARCITEDDIRQAYRTADLVPAIRMEKPSDPPVPEPA